MASFLKCRLFALFLAPFLPLFEFKAPAQELTPRVIGSIDLPVPFFTVQSDPSESYRAASYGYDGILRVFDFRTGKAVWSYDSHAVRASYASISYSLDGRSYALTTLGTASFFEVFDAVTGKMALQQPGFWPQTGSIVAFPPQTALYRRTTDLSPPR